VITATQIVDLALSQEGDRYVFGVEVSPSNSNPAAFDCSELVQWVGARLGVIPTLPDGSWFQAQHCRSYGQLVPVAYGIATKGALLFSFSSEPFGNQRPSSAHVAISQGNGRTIEARSTAYGVGEFTAIGRGWTHAGKIPGVTYTVEAPIVAGVPSDWAKEAWGKAVARGIVRGSHPQSLASVEQVMTYLDRLGLLD
jgi:cell wall-associated NlpC family hydrolase